MPKLFNYKDEPYINDTNSLDKKEYKEDTSFKLINRKINKDGELWITTFPIRKKLILNQNNAYNNKDEDNYLYEFIATTNNYISQGKDKVEFFGLKKNKKGEYVIIKIKEIPDISCSTEAETICQIRINIYVLDYKIKNQLDKQMDLLL